MAFVMDPLPSAFDAMTRYPQWVVWRGVMQESGKMDKLPVDPKDTRRKVSAHDPAMQMTAAAAVSVAKAAGLGVGFVFTENDPFFFLDIDHALVSGGWSPLAQNLCVGFSGCLVEVSQSGQGLHIIGTGTPPPHRCKNAEQGLELYHTGRFVALTGDRASGDAGHDAGPALAGLADQFFPPAEPTEDIDLSMGPDPAYSGPQDDDQLLAMMLRSNSAAAAFGGRASFRELWEADAIALGKVFPHANGFDHSSADASLMSHLAFWTGKDPGRMDRLFRRSALMRDKYGDRDDYKASTIKGAVAICKQIYSRGGQQAESLPPAALLPMDQRPDALRFLPTNAQPDHFKGCVYVRNLHRAYVPDGSLIRPDQFRAQYGGYTYSLDAYNERTTRNAWEAFTENQGVNFPKVTSVCFRPERPSGEIIQEEGLSMVNIYAPIDTPSTPGDPTPFLVHLGKLVPSEIDRGILLAYMAAMVQNPGAKFQWAPLLQGAEGNGKTLFIRVLSHCIGSRHTHLPNAADIGNKFNSWILGKLFIGIEEVNVGDKQEIIDTLKPLITDDRVEIHAKGADQVTGDNRANFFLCSNHKMAIRKTINDRRYAVIYTAQQHASDLVRDGMNGDYFPALYTWAKNGGYAIINDYLRNYPIPPALNPATGLQRAPMTTSTSEAIAVSQGGLEQEIVEAAAEGRPGFAGGWLSSMALDRLLQERHKGRTFTRNKRKEILEALGYQPHPGLTDGRVSTNINPEAGKPRLYILAGHGCECLQGSAEISRAYQEAQGWPVA